MIINKYSINTKVFEIFLLLVFFVLPFQAYAYSNTPDSTCINVTCYGKLFACHSSEGCFCSAYDISSPITGFIECLPANNTVMDPTIINRCKNECVGSNFACYSYLQTDLCQCRSTNDDAPSTGFFCAPVSTSQSCLTSGQTCGTPLTAVCCSGLECNAQRKCATPPPTQSTNPSSTSSEDPVTTTGPVKLENPINQGFSYGLISVGGNVAGILFGMIGGIGVAIVIYGGFLMMTSAGSPERIEKGKAAIIWAVVGIALALFSYIILQFVVNAAKGVATT